MQAQVTKLDFTGQNFFCGIDMHKKSWANPRPANNGFAIHSTIPE